MLPENGSMIQQSSNQQQKEYAPSFKAGGFTGALNLFGSTMQGIEDGACRKRNAGQTHLRFGEYGRLPQRG